MEKLKSLLYGEYQKIALQGRRAEDRAIIVNGFTWNIGFYFFACSQYLPMHKFGFSVSMV